MMEHIEREQHLTQLSDAWGEVKGGNGCLALVSGEAGIGKTSLIERFVSRLGRHARVLWGVCDALFSPQPLGPFIEIAGQIQSNLSRQHLLRFLLGDFPVNLTTRLTLPQLKPGAVGRLAQQAGRPPREANYIDTNLEVSRWRTFWIGNANGICGFASWKSRHHFPKASISERR